jgi:ABC-type branched-subunit amino acid transport system ATPase component
MSSQPILKIDNLDVHYGDLQAVWDVSLTVERPHRIHHWRQRGR